MELGLRARSGNLMIAETAREAHAIRSLLLVGVPCSPPANLSLLLFLPLSNFVP